MLPIGTQLGHYRILNLIKRGGMGEVYRAEDTRLPRQVAIKVVQSEPTLYPNVTASQEAGRLFQREMMAIATLDHPHILPLIDFGEQRSDDSQITYMVTPLRSEGSLSDWLRRRDQADPLSAEEVGSLLRQAASALSYAHSRGFVHQDVKPSNFLIREREEQPQCPDVLLADFGAVKITGISQSSTNVRGTLEYMAPEQLNGHAVAASDQYALAIMVYELLTGEVPFRGMATRVIFQHAQEPPQPPSTVNPRVPRQLDPVILRALAKDPEERFPSTTAFSNAFDLALQRKEVDDHSEEKTPVPGPDDLHDKKTIPPLDAEYFWQQEEAALLLYPGHHNREPRHATRLSSIGRALVATLVVLLVLAGGIGVAFGAFNNKSTSNGSQASTGDRSVISPATIQVQSQIDVTATATALARASATALAQASANATATAQVQANTNATATALAQASANATATVLAVVPTPTRPPPPSIVNIEGTYDGTIHNPADHISAHMTLVIQQDKKTIEGDLTIDPPLGNGDDPISGSTGTDSAGRTYVQFTSQFTARPNAAGYTLDFQGYLHADGSLSGSYNIEQTGESGTWVVSK